jgi:hypothetical protein
MSVVSCGKGLFFEYPTDILVIFFSASSRENRGGGNVARGLLKEGEPL